MSGFDLTLTKRTKWKGCFTEISTYQDNQATKYRSRLLLIGAMPPILASRFSSFNRYWLNESTQSGGYRWWDPRFNRSDVIHRLAHRTSNGEPEESVCMTLANWIELNFGGLAGYTTMQHDTHYRAIFSCCEKAFQDLWLLPSGVSNRTKTSDKLIQPLCTESNSRIQNLDRIFVYSGNY